jgi:hypothetical protein
MYTFTRSPGDINWLYAKDGLNLVICAMQIQIDYY